MITLQDKTEFNAVVNDINKNLITPYNNANKEMKIIESSVKSIQEQISDLHSIVNDINITLAECRNIYYNKLLKR